MEAARPVERMTDDEVLATFGTSEDPASQGFDAATHTRVMASELVRARGRLGHYRTLYAAFLAEGKRYMIENLNEVGDAQAVPAKLVFSDDAEPMLGLEGSAAVIVWTEPELLGALAKERAVLDYYTDLLDELEPALRGA